MRRILFLTPLLFILAGSAEAYVRATTEGIQTGTARSRADNANIVFLVNDQTVAGLKNRDDKFIITADSDPMGALQRAADQWDNAPDGDLSFSPLATTTLGIDPNDGMHVIHFADTDEARTIVMTALAVARSFFGPNGIHVDTDIVFNPTGVAFNPPRDAPFATTLLPLTFDIESVAAHEIGHSLGLAHSGTIGATMFPRTGAATAANRALKEDELAFVRDVYPAAGTQGNFGSITGTISLGATLSKGEGGTANGVFVTAVNPDTGAVVTALSSVANGTYRIGRLRPGSYLVSAEPADGPAFFFDYSGANRNLINPNIQDGFFGGSASPTAVNVTAGGNAGADFAVGAGPPAVRIDAIGRAPAGDPNQFMNFGAGALAFSPGDASDLVLSGPGLDGTLGNANVRILNSNITIRPGSVFFDQFGFLRMTIDVAAAVAGVQLASIVVTKGADTALYTGGLVIEGTETHEVTGVFDAAGFQALISPGSIVAVGGLFTDVTANATTVPLPTNLNGFSVTFNGILGAMFGVFDGVFDQANVQVPWDVDVSSGGVDVRVVWTKSKGNVVSNAFRANAALASPGIFEFPAGQAIVTNFSQAGDDVIQGSWAQPVGSVPDVVAQPAPLGGVVTVWCNGLGPVTDTPATGDIPRGDLPFTTKTVRVFIGGQLATIIGAPILQPTSVGLNQINVFVPDGVAPGDAVPIVIEVDCGNGQVFRSRAGVTIALRAGT